MELWLRVRIGQKVMNQACMPLHLTRPSTMSVHPLCKVVGDGRRAADAASEEYVELLLRELKATISGGIDPRRIRAAGGLSSIFFGGGTPSLTPPVLVQRVVEALEEAFGLAEGAEVRCLSV